VISERANPRNSPGSRIRAARLQLERATVRIIYIYIKHSSLRVSPISIEWVKLRWTEW